MHLMYVANLKVQKTDRVPGARTTPDRRVGHELNLTVKAESLDRLKEKLAAHIDLLDEEDVNGHQ